MKNELGSIVGILAVLALIGLACWYEVTVWGECLDKNSFLYCMRVMSK